MVSAPIIQLIRRISPNRRLTLDELFTLCKKQNQKGEILGSLLVNLANGLAVKIVFIQNRNKKSEWLALLSTDCSLDEKEIVRIYGMRWQIETFFKFIKSYLNLTNEFQGRAYDMLISHTTIVFSRYILVAWESRKQEDPKTFGGLFYLLCDEVTDFDYKTALRQLWTLVQGMIRANTKNNNLVCQLNDWIATLPRYTKELLPNLSCES